MSVILVLCVQNVLDVLNLCVYLLIIDACLVDTCGMLFLVLLY